MGIAALLAAASLAATPVQRAADYLEAHRSGAGFAEPRGRANASLSAWVSLGLAAAGRSPGRETAGLVAQLGRPGASATDLALAVLSVEAAGGDARPLLRRLVRLERRSGQIGPTVNSTVWAVIALAQLRSPVPDRTPTYLIARQGRSGGWSWARGGAPDSNDTAAAVQALTAIGFSGAPVARGLRYLRRLENRDGGFPLLAGRASDAQSTAWAVQAFLAARRSPPRPALRYLLRLQRRDGSFRYSRRYGFTPVWVTAQVLPALAGRPFPLRARGPGG